MPSPSRFRSGQASADYVALLAVVAVVLAGAGAAVGAHGAVAGAIVRQLGVALCVVGGDVCRSADAERRGLEPCVVRERMREGMTTLSFLIEVARGTGFTVEHLSDGRIVLTATERGDGGGGLAAGVTLGGKSVGAEAQAGLGWREGRGWIFDSEAELRRFVRRYPPRAIARERGARFLEVPQPDFVLSERGRFGSASAGIEDLAELEASGRRMLGRRVGRDGLTTYYFDGASSAPLLPRRAGRWVFEVTTARGGRPVRATYRTIGTDEETVAVLDLADPAARAASLALIRIALHPTAPQTFAEQRRLMRLALPRHRIERRRYRTGDVVDKGLGLALIVGARHQEVGHVRRLVSATLEDGTLRADCVPSG